MKLITAILVVFVILIIYWIGQNMSKTQETEIEKFTALSGISNPLTSHDDYGTFNFIMPHCVRLQGTAANKRAEEEDVEPCWGA